MIGVPPRAAPQPVCDGRPHTTPSQRQAERERDRERQREAERERQTRPGRGEAPTALLGCACEGYEDLRERQTDRGRERQTETDRQTERDREDYEGLKLDTRQSQNRVLNFKKAAMVQESSSMHGCAERGREERTERARERVGE